MKKVYKIILLLVISINTILVSLNVALVLLRNSAESENLTIAGLYLTPHIKQGHIEDAQKLSKVHNAKFHHIESYAGYLTVDELKQSHTFFWHFPSEKPSTEVPLILWLNGGPGWSSLYGLFAEIGPFYPKSATELSMRKHSWHKEFNLLFFDNPLGTGFSRTLDGQATNQAEIGRDLYTALKQFFKLFPKLIDCDFYLAGDSYAGKYIPALGHVIHTNNQRNRSKINLKGLMIGNGFTDPVNQLNYGDFLHQHGLIDSQQADIFKSLQDKCIHLIKEKNFLEAYKVFSDIILGDSEVTKHGSLFMNFTGFSNAYNYLIPYDIDPMLLYIEEFMNQKDVKRSLHVDDEVFRISNDLVFKALKSDMLTSVVSWLEELLGHYRVLLFTGQLDIIVGYPNVHNFVKKMNFSGSEDYHKLERSKWHVGGELAGYFTVAGNLTEVMVRKAGHEVSRDQPAWTLDMVDRFINKKAFN